MLRPVVRVQGGLSPGLEVLMACRVFLALLTKTGIAGYAASSAPTLSSAMPSSVGPVERNYRISSPSRQDLYAF